MQKQKLDPFKQGFIEIQKRLIIYYYLNNNQIFKNIYFFNENTDNNKIF